MDRQKVRLTGHSSFVKKMEEDYKKYKEMPWHRRVWHLYYDGFRNMTVGRYLWVIIIAKLVVLFLVFKLFFFPNILERDYATDDERAQAVRTHLIGE